MAHFNFLVAYALRLYHIEWDSQTSSFRLEVCSHNSHGFGDVGWEWDERKIHSTHVRNNNRDRKSCYSTSHLVIFSRKYYGYCISFSSPPFCVFVFFVFVFVSSFLLLFLFLFVFCRCDCNNHIGDLTIQSHFVLYHIVDRWCNSLLENTFVLETHRP